jgi:Helix-turn-helix domain
MAVKSRSTFGLNQFAPRHQVIGLAPHQYLLRCRLQNAQKLLSTDAGRSIGDVAAEAGFADQAHLARHFRCAFGKSLQQFRRAHKETKQSARRVLRWSKLTQASHRPSLAMNFIPSPLDVLCLPIALRTALSFRAERARSTGSSVSRRQGKQHPGKLSCISGVAGGKMHMSKLRISQSKKYID